MEAKEIVAKEVARQKEFGYEPSWEDFVIAGRKAGIREVVEWVNHERTNQNPSVWYSRWQAKLKEWGVNKDV